MALARSSFQPRHWRVFLRRQFNKQTASAIRLASQLELEWKKFVWDSRLCFFSCALFPAKGKHPQTEPEQYLRLARKTKFNVKQRRTFFEIFCARDNNSSGMEHLHDQLWCRHCDREAEKFSELQQLHSKHQNSVRQCWVQGNWICGEWHVALSERTGEEFPDAFGDFHEFLFTLSLNVGYLEIIGNWNLKYLKRTFTSYEDHLLSFWPPLSSV